MRMQRFAATVVMLAATMAVLRAETISRTATATVTIGGLAKLTLSATALAFPDADPDTVPAIPAAGGPISIGARARTTLGSPVTLVVQAGSDLRSGLDTIPATQLRWTAVGTGFVGGTMSYSAAQPVASWTGSGAWTGTQSYTLLNSWNYPTGTYSATLTYTLTAP
mgnify:FL=1|jgi:hypothetical protein